MTYPNALFQQAPALDTSQEYGELLAAFIAAWAELPDITRDLTANVTKKDGTPSYRYNYADLGSCLAAVRPILTAHKLAVMQPITDAPDGTPIVTTLIVHTSGQWMRSTFSVKPTARDPQAIGSAITYARRYALLAALNLATADDDGRAASARPAPRAEPEPGPDPFVAAGWDDAEAHDTVWLPLRDLTRAASQDVKDRVKMFLGDARRPFTDQVLAGWAAILADAPDAAPGNVGADPASLDPDTAIVRREWDAVAAAMPGNHPEAYRSLVIANAVAAGVPEFVAEVLVAELIEAGTAE